MTSRHLSFESLAPRTLMAVDVFVPTDSFSWGETDDPVAAVEIFLKLPDVHGEAESGSGGGAGKVSMNDISFTFDEADLGLTGDADPAAAHVDYFLKLEGVDGESTDDKAREGEDTSLIELLRTADEETYLKIELENVMITSYQTGGSESPEDDYFATLGDSESSERPMESLSLNYGEVKG